ncbi:MAG: hypothetical protein C0458_15960 [Methylobacterium sp.]|nr:hypothetical protein [Methylobacterium sp.]
MAKLKHLVLSKLTFDGKDYGPAEDEKTIVLDEKIAGPLVDAGVLSEGAVVAAPEGEERSAALVEFFKTLAMGDFTAAGGLRAEAKRRAIAAIGFEPTDEELRDAAKAFAEAQASA